MATDYQSLFDVAACYASCAEASEIQTLKIALIAQAVIQLDPTANVEPQDLIDQGRCFGCLGASEVEMMELALLALLVNASGGGGGSVQCGNYAGGEPTFTPATCGVAIDTSNERIWWYYNGAWH